MSNELTPVEKRLVEYATADGSELLTLSEAMAHYGFSKAKLIKLIHNRELRCLYDIRDGRKVTVIPESEFEKRALSALYKFRKQHP
jgi:hypothetical protein